jgi:hypothetical protein
MKLPVSIAILLVAGTAHAQLVTEMTPAKIKEALADRKTPECYEGLRLGYWWTRIVPIGCFSTPYSRVIQLRHRREERGLPSSEPDIPVELIAAGELWVFAYHWTCRYVQSPMVVVSVVVGPHNGRGGEGVIQPLKLEEVMCETERDPIPCTKAVFPLSVLSEKNEFRAVYDCAGGDCGAGSWLASSASIRSYCTGEHVTKIKMKNVK